MSKCRCEKVDGKDDMNKRLWEKEIDKKDNMDKFRPEEMRNKIWAKDDEKNSMRKTYWAHAENLSRNKSLLLSAQCVPNHWKWHLEDQLQWKQALEKDPVRSKELEWYVFLSTSEIKAEEEQSDCETESIAISENYKRSKSYN